MRGRWPLPTGAVPDQMLSSRVHPQIRRRLTQRSDVQTRTLAPCWAPGPDRTIETWIAVVREALAEATFKATTCVSTCTGSPSERAIELAKASFGSSEGSSRQSRPRWIGVVAAACSMRRSLRRPQTVKRFRSRWHRYRMPTAVQNEALLLRERSDRNGLGDFASSDTKSAGGKAA